MHITLETDYAIRILIYLMRKKERVDAKNIAEGTDVTLRFALKILRKLVAADLVKSYKGIKGGYEFAKESPKEVSLYDAIRVVEGNCYLSRCLDENVGCNRGRTGECKVHNEFCKISHELQKSLSDVTFDRLI